MLLQAQELYGFGRWEDTAWAFAASARTAWWCRVLTALLFLLLHPRMCSVGNTMDSQPWLCQVLLLSKHLGRILHPHS